MSITEDHHQLDSLASSIDNESFNVRVTSGDACWSLQRSYENFVLFDQQLHRCIFDRKFSALPQLPEFSEDVAENSPNAEATTQELLSDYMARFSRLDHQGLNCGPVLNWLQLDNRGRRILVPEADNCPINTPAVAAAYAVRPYVAQAQDEISFQVGDMISVIDMPPPGESTWWRGKHGFAVGFFPAECVAVIGDKVPRHLAIHRHYQAGQRSSTRQQPVKPVLRKHGKLIAFFRSFILNRPSRRRLKQSGILKERVFGCDLGEHLLNSGQDGEWLVMLKKIFSTFSAMSKFNDSALQLFNQLEKNILSISITSKYYLGEDVNSKKMIFSGSIKKSFTPPS